MSLHLWLPEAFCFLGSLPRISFRCCWRSWTSQHPWHLGELPMDILHPLKRTVSSTPENRPKLLQKERMIFQLSIFRGFLLSVSGRYTIGCIFNLPSIQMSADKHRLVFILDRKANDCDVYYAVGTSTNPWCSTQETCLNVSCIQWVTPQLKGTPIWCTKDLFQWLLIMIVWK